VGQFSRFLCQKGDKLIENLKAGVPPFVLNGHDVTGRKVYLLLQPFSCPAFAFPRFLYGLPESPKVVFAFVTHYHINLYHFTSHLVKAKRYSKIPCVV
jgi:hypothetical protein